MTALTLEHRLKRKASIVSLVVSLIVFLLKVFAYNQTKSTAVLSDALEGIVNVVAAAFALWVIYIASKPADEDHPYGHGKLEYFSASFEGGFVFFAAIAIFFESSKALMHGQNLKQLDFGIAIIVIAGLINLFLGLYLKSVGTKHKSEALVASGQHVLTDFWTSLAVIVGLLIVLFTGWTWVDPVMGILLSFHLAGTGFMIVRRSIGALMDEFDPEALESLASAIRKNRVEGFIDIHQMRVIRSGHFHHVDAHLVIPEFWNIAVAHEWSEDFENSIVRDYPFDGEFAFHLDPCKKSYCEQCDLQNCPIRVKAFQKHKEITVQSLTGGVQPQYSSSHE